MTEKKSPRKTCKKLKVRLNTNTCEDPLPEPLDIKACDEFFEALEAEEVEV